MICLTCKTNEVPHDGGRQRFMCDECLHAELTNPGGKPAPAPPKPAVSENAPRAYELIPVLRNAKRRLVFGLSPDALHAVRDAAAASSALFKATIEALALEAQLSGNLDVPEDANAKAATGMFLGYLSFNSPSVISGVMERCIARLEASVR